MYHKCYVQTIIKATDQLIEKIAVCLDAKTRPVLNEILRRLKS